MVMYGSSQVIVVPQGGSGGFEYQGFGGQTTGGAGGRIIEVDTLNDSGPGSFREALRASGPRIVVFRVGGSINLQSRIDIVSGNLTIAGETAPGGGIMIRHGAIMIRSSNVIVRYLRFRWGDSQPFGSPNPEETRKGQLYIYVWRGSANVVLDHISGCWTLDEGITIYKDYSQSEVESQHPDVTNVTVQRSNLSEGLGRHSTGSQTSGGGGDGIGWIGVHEITWHHNLFATNGQRNPLTKTKGSEVINNVVYNTPGEIGQFIEGAVGDWVANHYIAGPIKPFPGNGSFIMMEPTRTGAVNFVSETSIYIADNLAPTYGLPNPQDDNWRLIQVIPGDGPLPLQYRRFSRLPQPPIPVVIEPVQSVFNSVMSDVGANAKLGKDGIWRANSDSVDQRILNYTATNTGPASMVQHQDQVGGYPVIAPAAPGEAAAPGEWETLRSLLE